MAARAVAVVLAVTVEPKPKVILAAERALDRMVVPVPTEVPIMVVVGVAPVVLAALVRAVSEKPTASPERR